MLGSDSAGILPPFHKTPHVSSSIAPFKSSLNKNPSYFSLVRSPDVLLEKKKLKEENWRLKQLLHSLNEENLKLKQKLSQKSEPRLSMADGSQFVNQSRYIDVLQDSLRMLRSELNKKKQENLELKKKLAKDEKPADAIKVKSSRGSFHSNDSQNEQGQEKLVNELTRNVTYLQSEVRIMQEDRAAALSKVSELREKLQDINSRKVELSIQKMEGLSVETEKIILKLPKRLNSSLNLRLDGDRVLKRENLKSDQANVNRFFRNFFMELSNNNLELKSVINYINRSVQDLSLDLFIETLNYYRIRVNPVEIEETFNFIKDGKNLTKDEFIAILKNYGYEYDSSKSSDISSGSESPAAVKITITKHVESGVSTVFDNISLHLREIAISKEDIVKKCEDGLNLSVNFSGLLAFFQEHDFLITDPNDRTFVTVNFMEGFELKSRKEITEKCLEGFFKFPDDFEMNLENVERILQEISEVKDEFLLKCREYDTLSVETLSWEVLHELLKNMNLVTEKDVIDLKFHCYFLNKNLKKIPYSALVSETSLKVEVPEVKPQIKTFFRMKTVNKQ
jgi:cytochrome c556